MTVRLRMRWLPMNVGLGLTRIQGLRAYDPLRRRSRLPGPYGVQLQTVDRCNAACVMCPYSMTERPGPAHMMDDRLYTRILEGLRRTGVQPSLCLMLQNEPLLDRRFEARVTEARRLFGRRLHVSTVTNASLLTEGRVRAILASGLSTISVSIDAACEETYRSIRRGLDFRKVVRNTEALVSKAGRRVSVRFLRQRGNEGEERAFARYWRARGARVAFEPLTNRAGSLDAFERLRSGHTSLLRRLGGLVLNRLFRVCPLPFATMTVLWDGRVTLCCHDWEPRAVVGDLSRQSVAEVWNGEAMNHYRHLLRTGRWKESDVCRDCSLAANFWNL